MAEVTDKDVATKRKAVESLREKIEAEKMKSAQKRSSSENQVRLARLEQTEDALQAELDFLREQNKTANAVTKDTVASIGEDGVTQTESNPVDVDGAA
jgi:hypothetical protein